jgi:hypothetical protein
MRPWAPSPRLIRSLLPMLSWMTARYIAYHRNRLWPLARTLDDRIQMQLSSFFPQAALAETRVVQAVLPDPAFYPLVRNLGFQGLLEMSSIGAITLMDVVAYPQQLDLGTLFHELVHVVQYRVLGLKRFSELYVKGFLLRGGYARIPLEQQAYELGARFDESPGIAFSVEEEVIRRHEAGTL